MRPDDLRAVFDYATSTLRVRETEQLRPMLAGLARVVGSDSATLTRLNLRTQHEVAVFWPPSRRPGPELLPAYAALGHTHPLRRPLLRLADAPPAEVAPVRVSDVLTQREWTGTPLYREVMTGTSDQIVLPVSFQGATTRAVTLSRESGTFTDRQRDILAACAEHLRAAAERVEPAGVRLAPRLSPREDEVLRLVAQGLTDAQIARRLDLRPATVSKHLHRIYTRLGVRNRAQAVQVTRSGGELPPA